MTKINFIKEIDPFAYYWIVENELGNTQHGINFSPPLNYPNAIHFPLYTEKQLFDAVKSERDACAQLCESITSKGDATEDVMANMISDYCAAKIRART